MEQMMLIKQGTIHDAVHEEPYQADILIAEGKIKKIAPVLEGKIINEAKIIDASGKHVYPGFVEAHCHMGLDGYGIGFEGYFRKAYISEISQSDKFYLHKIAIGCRISYKIIFVKF